MSIIFRATTIAIMLCFVAFHGNILLGKDVPKQELIVFKAEAFPAREGCFIVKINRIYYKDTETDAVNINCHADNEELINIVKSNLGNIDLNKVFCRESTFLIKDAFEINYQSNREHEKSREIFQGTVIAFGKKDVHLNFKYHFEQSVCIDASRNLWSTTGVSCKREGQYTLGKNMLISSSSFEEAKR